MDHFQGTFTLTHLRCRRRLQNPFLLRKARRPYPRLAHRNRHRLNDQQDSRFPEPQFKMRDDVNIRVQNKRLYRQLEVK